MRAMSVSDFIIIYLACGTPFGMYHFINNRKSDSHWLTSLLTVFVWIPYALVLLREKTKFFIKSNSSNNNLLPREDEFLLEKTKKQLESFLAGHLNFFPIFEYRETIERYTGLTIALLAANSKPTNKEKEFFKISANENKKLAAECLHRRNRKLLSFHHTLARQDFLNFTLKYKDELSEMEIIYNLLLKIAEILRDDEAVNLLKLNFTGIPQSAENENVSQLEKELWNSETHKQPPAKSLTSSLKVMSAPTNLPFKD